MDKYTKLNPLGLQDIRFNPYQESMNTYAKKANEEARKFNKNSITARSDAIEKRRAMKNTMYIPEKNLPNKPSAKRPSRNSIYRNGGKRIGSTIPMVKPFTKQRTFRSSQYHIKKTHSTRKQRKTYHNRLSL
jgi:hypothetical protein